MTQFCTSGAAAPRSREARYEVPDPDVPAEMAAPMDAVQPAIAEAVGLSEAAVRRRVQRLRESGIMQIVAVTDPLQLGFTRQAMIGVSVEGDVRRVADKLSSMPEVDYVVMCAGSFDILAEIVCEDDERLLHVLNDSVRSIPGVRATETFLYLKLAKQTYTWGTR
jgi:Lrp/AsnC family transcriptional regulator, regulator for asnA, asnC and gidA